MRRNDRECALQILYQLDLGGLFAPGEKSAEQLDAAIAHYWGSFDKKKVTVDKDFSERMVRGIFDHVDSLDATIQGVARRWRMDRMNAVDRNLLRLAAYEILHCPDIPRGVSINEALEIAKKFSGEESRAFINGLLDQLGRGDSGEIK